MVDVVDVADRGGRGGEGASRVETRHEPSGGGRFSGGADSFRSRVVWTW